MSHDGSGRPTRIAQSLRSTLVCVDLAVWEGPHPASDDEAARTFRTLYRRFVKPGHDAPPSERIAAYVHTLLDRFPDLTELDDDAIEESPWTDGPMIDNASGQVFFLNIVANEAGEDAWAYAVSTARSAGLVCFDPESGALAT
jgi:hypothetical protein